jgi:uncharacterized protein (DUF2267 family)
MDHEQFLVAVQRLAGVDGAAAERVTRAVLQTLGERISAVQARDLVAQLPAELGPWLFTEDAGQGFDVDEFLRRVAERAQVDLATAQRYARAVLAALSQAVSAEEFADMVAQLPKDYAFLLPSGPAIEVPAVEELLGRVAERAGLDLEGACRATEAVLETLAERIAPGEVDDLISRLPVPLHAPLKQGKARNPDPRSVQGMSLERFLDRVAERAGVPPEDAGRHARAVFTTLREAVSDEEFFDVTVQLPPEYDVLWAGSPSSA